MTRVPLGKFVNPKAPETLGELFKQINELTVRGTRVVFHKYCGHIICPGLLLARAAEVRMSSASGATGMAPGSVCTFPSPAQWMLIDL